MIDKIFSFNDFDLNKSSLIEASAGTGKTYTLERIYLKAICNGIPPEKILAVTFTIKAAGEIKERVRNLLIECLTTKENKIFIEILGNEYREDKIKKYRYRCQKAVADIDHGWLMTIHSFCSKVLTEYSTECNYSSVMEQKNTFHLLKTLVRDLSKKYLSQLLKEEDRDVLFSEIKNITKHFKLRITDDKELTSFEQGVYTLAHKIIENPVDLFEISEYQNLKNLKNTLLSNKKVHQLIKLIHQFFENLDLDYFYSFISKITNEVSHNKKFINEKVTQLSSAWQDYICRPENQNFKSIWNFVTKEEKGIFLKLFFTGKVTLKKETKFLKDIYQLFADSHYGELYRSLYELPEIIFSEELISELIEYDLIQSKYLIPLLKEIKKNIHLLKQQQGSTTSFGDLIYFLRQALQDDRLPIAKILSYKFNLVLVDEFQDTDAWQWDIFKSFTLNKAKPIILIGDPKQAIYQFRGGDLAVYYKAKEDILAVKGDIFYLDKNYRTHEYLLNSLAKFWEKILPREKLSKENAKFLEIKYYLKLKSNCLNSNQIELQEIFFQKYFNNVTLALPLQAEYQKVKAAANEQKFIKSQHHLFLMEFLNEKITTEKARFILSNEIVRQIFQLIKNNFITPNQLNEVAILCGSNNDVKEIVQFLIQNEIPAVANGDHSIWQTQEAKDVCEFLELIYIFKEKNNFKALLLHPFFSFSLEKMNQLEEENILFFWFEQFQKWLTLLEAGEFYLFFYQILHFKSSKMNLENSYLEKIWNKKNKQRKVTNLLQIIELIHLSKKEGLYNCQTIIQWVKRKIQESEISLDENEKLRLDSTTPAVQVMTMHLSKGLEFQVVFLYDFTNHKEIYTGDILYAKKEENISQKLIAFPGIFPEVLKKLAKENFLREKMRMYYVALTRAKSFLFLPIFKKDQFIKESDKKINYYFFSHFTPLPSAEVLKDVIETSEKKETRSKKCSWIQIISMKESNKLPENVNSTIISEKAKNKDENYSFYCPPIPSEEIRLKHKEDVSYSKLVHLNYWHSNENMEDEQLLEMEEEIYLSAHISNKKIEHRFILTGGIQLGNAIHEIFENINYQKGKLSFSEFIKDREIISLVENKINIFLGKTYWNNKENQQAILEIIWDSFNVDIGGYLESQSWFLNQLLKSDRINEFEFQMKISQGSLDLDIFSQQRSLEVACDGYISGFIDLLFRQNGKYYIVDWKSNLLGVFFEDYQKDCLLKTMIKRKYDLQLLIYSVALHQWLSKTIKDYNYQKYFGGIFYIFNRGIKVGTNQGIFYHKPKLQILESMIDSFNINKIENTSPRA